MGQRGAPGIGGISRAFDRAYSETMTVAPAFAVPPHLRHGPKDGLCVWFTQPPGAVLQLSTPQRFTIEQAHWIVGPALEQLLVRFPAGEKLTLIFDFRNMTSRDLSARTVLMEHANDIVHRFSHVFIVPPLQSNPIYRVALQAAVALVSAFGASFVIVESLDEVIAERSLRADAG
jgi:hypothetical protein